MIHNQEAEQSLLASMILDNSIISEILDLVDEDSFYFTEHKDIFNEIKSLNKENTPVDMVTLNKDIKYIYKITSIMPTSANWSYYLKIVKEKENIRKLLNIAQDITKQIYEQSNSEEILASAEKTILSINRSANQNLISIQDTMISAINQLEERCKKKGELPGISTGFWDVDFKIGGLQDKNFYIIAARPSMGKTSFAENIATYVGYKCNQPVAFFSAEMSKEDVVNRMISSMCFIDNDKIKLGTLDFKDWDKIWKVSAEIAKSKLIIDDTPRPKVSDIAAKCRRIKKQHGDLRLIVIDHLTELYRQKKRDIREEIEDNLEGLSSLRKEMGCPLILLAQLNRACEQRNDKRPILSDFKETGRIEEVADVVMFLYRDEYYNPESNKKGIGEVIIAKGRNVGIGTVELGWYPKYTKFQNLEWKRQYS